MHEFFFIFSEQIHSDKPQGIEMASKIRFTLHLLFLYVMSATRFQPVLSLTKETKYIRDPFCHLASSCSTQPTQVRSLLDCVTLLNNKASCENILYVASTQACYDITGCEVDPACSTFDPDLFHYKLDTGTSAPGGVTPSDFLPWWFMWGD